MRSVSGCRTLVVICPNCGWQCLNPFSTIMTSSNGNNTTCEDEAGGCEVADLLLVHTPWDAPHWSREETLSLIESYRLRRPLVGTEGLRRMHDLWEAVSNDLKGVVSTYVTPRQCENRWRVLERNFRKFNKKSPGGRRKQFEFQKELEGLVSLEKSSIEPETVLAVRVLTESPEINSISKNHEVYFVPGPSENSPEGSGYQTPPSKKRKIKKELPPPRNALVDDRRNEICQERSKGWEQREEQSLEIQKNILKTLQEANDMHREAVKQMAEHNKQMAEHNALLRKYIKYRMSFGVP